MPDTTNTDVLVVGAGPVGLTAAIEIARLGRHVHVVDAAAGPATSSRALGVHARTQEMLDRLGLLDDLQQQGAPVAAFSVHAHGRRLARLELDLTPTPSIVGESRFLAQVDTESLLRGALEPFGVRPQWQTRLLDFEQDGETVQARVTHPTRGVHSIRARYLIGADGGRSTVRKVAGIAMEGDSDETWLVADARVDWHLPNDSIHLIRTRRGTVVAFPFPDTGRWRLLDTTETSSIDHTAMARRFTAKLGPALRHDVTVTDLSWSSEFTIQQRAVPDLRAGRVFLAGDAAHVHSPASGQGMNTGIQDAVNLGWKLVAALNGAPETILDTYTAERRPVSADLLRTAAVATRLLQARSIRVRVGTVLALPLLEMVPALQRRVNRRAAAAFSALTIRYNENALVRLDTLDPAGPKPGERVTQYTQGDLGGAAIRSALRNPGWLLVRTAPSDVPLPADGQLFSTVLDLADHRPSGWPARIAWYLVRPDGVVAARGPIAAAVPGDLVPVHSHDQASR